MPQTPNARSILETLVSFPTVSRDSNLELIDWVETYLEGFGVAAHRVYNEDGTKASLYANVGPEVEGGIVLSGHTDVVPVDGQDWTSDPWVVTERGGRLYGRGTCDMKGFDALALAAVPWALEAGVKRPLQIALSYDEEVGCKGAPPMIADMGVRLPKAAGAIIGEPSMMRPVTGHKGGYGWQVLMRGYAVHSSMMDRGVNAIMEGARLIDWVNALNDRIRAREPGPLAAAFDPPFTTVHVGMISGGTANNITAAECHFSIDFRIVPGDDVETYRTELMARVAEIEAGMKTVRPEAGIDIFQRVEVPGLVPEQSGPAEELVRALTGDNGSHVVSYGTEAGQFQEAGHSAVICGPGDIAQAHQADEFIELSQLAAGEDFMRRLVARLAA